VILDEAHQLPDTATLFFGETLSSAQLLELSRDVRAETLAGARDTPEAQRLAGALDKAARDLRLALPKEARASRRRRSPGGCFLGRACGAGSWAFLLVRCARSPCRKKRGPRALLERAKQALALLERWRDESRADLVRWIEVLAHSLRLNATPLSSPRFSAGSSTGGRAPGSHLCHARRRGRLRTLPQGAGPGRRPYRLLGSPFDYGSQALLYVPRNLPDPNSEEHTRAVVAASLPVIRASGGSAFLLFTTLRAMRLAHRLLRDELDRLGLEFPLMPSRPGIAQ